MFYGDSRCFRAGLGIGSTPVASTPSVVTNNRNVFIIDSKNPEVFTSAINKIMKDDELSGKIRKFNGEK